jgi:hypothetical protein
VTEQRRQDLKSTIAEYRAALRDAGFQRGSAAGLKDHQFADDLSETEHYSPAPSQPLDNLARKFQQQPIVALKSREKLRENKEVKS